MRIPVTSLASGTHKRYELVGMSTRLPPKKDVLIALLERSSVFVHMDPRSDEVRVPKWFKRQPQLVLQIGLNMAVQIPDLQVVDEGIGCTLSFSRSPHHCFLPWSAIYALVAEDGRGMVWPDDIPPEVVVQAPPTGAQSSAAQVDSSAGSAAPGSGVAAAAPGIRPPQSVGAKPARRGSSSSSLRAIAGGSTPIPPQTDAAALGDSKERIGAQSEGAHAEKPRPSYLRVVK